jgi:four helix bundle protein
MKGDDLAERLLEFAVRVLRVVDALPKSTVGRNVGGQLARAGTAVGSHYEEARGAESRADFIHKLGIAWKELRESRYWLRLIQKAQLVKPELLEGLFQESNELNAVLMQSITTAKKNASDRPSARRTLTDP